MEAAMVKLEWWIWLALAIVLIGVIYWVGH